MSLSEKSRSNLYLGLCTVIDDQEAIGEMLAHFPVRDLDEPATKDHLRAEVAILDKKMTESFAHAAAERAALEQRLVASQARMAADLSAEMRRWFLATMALMLTVAGLVIAFGR